MTATTKILDHIKPLATKACKPQSKSCCLCQKWNYMFTKKQKTTQTREVRNAKTIEILDHGLGWSPHAGAIQNERQ